MFCAWKYAAYARINTAYRRALNGVHSTGKKAPIPCIWAALSERSYEGIGFISVAIVRGIKAKADVRSNTFS